MTTELLNSAATIGHNQAPVKRTEAELEAIAKTMKALEDSLGSIVNEELNDILVSIDNAAKETAAGPYKLLMWIGNNAADKVASFPTPSTTDQDSDVPDIYMEPYFRDGKKKFRKTSFYLKFFLGYIPEGKRIAAALAHIAIAKDEKANHAAVPADILALNPVDLEQLRSDLMKQQTRGVASLRNAVGLYKQLDAVNELKEVAAMPLTDKDGNVRKVDKPIKVWNTEAPETEWQLYSFSGFMQLDPAKAAEQDGTYAALKLTAKREQGEDGGDGQGDKPIVINTNATFAARINDVAEYIGNKMMPAGDKKRELYLAFLKDHVNGAGSNDLIYNLNEIKLFVDMVMTIPAVQTRLEEVNRMKNAS